MCFDGEFWWEHSWDRNMKTWEIKAENESMAEEIRGRDVDFFLVLHRFLWRRITGRMGA